MRAIMLRHILPNVITPAIVFSMSDVVLTILAVDSLGFLGLGIQPPTAEWGLMIAEGRTFMQRRLVDLASSRASRSSTSASAFTLLGDGLDDVLRPKG